MMKPGRPAATVTSLTARWNEQPGVNEVLRDIRRHFHTFKGNGRAVGANILGELGWAAQDMLDGVLDGDIAVSDGVQKLVDEVVSALPALVMSYRKSEGLDVELARDLTNRCFRVSKSGGTDLADELPHADEVLPQGAGSTQDDPLSEPLSH